MLENDEVPEKPSISTWPSFAAGTVAGLAGLAVGHPFDTVKVRLQSRTISGIYKGTWDCFTTIIRQEKVLGLYKGMASPAVGVAMINAMVFGIYGYLIEIQLSGSGQTDPKLWHMFLAGTGSGVVNSFITCPMELVKVRLQNQGIPSASSTHYRGPVDCAMQTLKAGGVRAIYKGMTATALREVSFGPYFVSYELFCSALRPPGKSVNELSGWRLVFAGGAAGIVAWCSTYAADVIKTRMQAEPDNTPKNLRYRGVWDCAKRCYREEGFRVFFKGLNATIVRAFPCNAATFVAYTYMMRALTANEFRGEEVRL